LIDLIYSKFPDIIIGLLLGILIMLLHRKADQKVHILIEEIHEYTVSQDVLINQIAQVMHPLWTDTRTGMQEMFTARINEIYTRLSGPNPATIPRLTED
jgi:hypothetical protein